MSDTVPQFKIKRPCACCPFRVDSELGKLGQRTAQRVVTEIDADQPFACHQTTTQQGRPLTHPAARYCAGAMLYSLARARAGEAPLPTFMRLGEWLGLWSPDDLQAVPVWQSRADFLLHHSEDT